MKLFNMFTFSNEISEDEASWAKNASKYIRSRIFEIRIHVPSNAQ